MKLSTIALVLGASLVATQVRADEIQYSVLQSDGLAPTNVAVSSDGMPLIQFAGAVPGTTYTISLAAWVASDSMTGSVAFPTDALPVTATNLTKSDFAFTPSPPSVVFTDYATPPVPPDPKDPGYTGIPVGSFQPVVVTFTVPPTLTSSDLFLAKISIASVTSLSSGTGALVAVTTSTTGAGTSFLTDTSFVQMSAAYNDTFQVIAKGTSVASTNPGSFYYLAVGQTGATAGDFTITVDALPQDFVLWGANAVHAYLGPVDLSNPEASPSTANGKNLSFTFANAPANTLVLLTVHCQYRPKGIADWATYLPKDYTFSSSFTSAGTTTTSSATMTGALKK